MEHDREPTETKLNDPFADLSALKIDRLATQSMPWAESQQASAFQPEVAMSSHSTGPIQVRSSSFTPRQYPALQAARVILRVLAFLLLGICLIGLMVLLVVILLASSQTNTETAGSLLGGGLAGYFGVSLPLLFTSLLLFSYAELISVFLDIQRNTQESAYYLRLKY